MDSETRRTPRPVLVLPVSPACCLVLGTLLHLTLSLSFLICDAAPTMMLTPWDSCEQLESVRTDLMRLETVWCGVWHSGALSVVADVAG